MLTPEELARLAVGESDWYTTSPEWEINFNRLRWHVADAIRAAIEAEREACALVCQEHQSFVSAGGDAFNAFGAAAADIRARGKAE